MAQDMKHSVSGAEASLACWCYRSLALPGMTLPDMLRLTEQAQRGNERLGVTGVLFFSAGRFLQWLEGPAEAVEVLISKILRDGRHSEIEILSQETVTRRRFGDWHMQLSCTEDEAAQLSQGERGEVIVVDPAALPGDGRQAMRGSSRCAVF
ncbi:BLUF domain-containing protein [Cereibacter changlensis]|uniref:BLUF domain-containing protein n=1 Tax=Cereibacter changlensis TaxID=402884 RepID=UPI004033883F